MRKLVAVLTVVAAMSFATFGFGRNAYAQNSHIITTFPTSIDAKISLQITFDSVYVAVQVIDWHGVQGGTFSFKGGRASVNGITMIISSHSGFLDAQKSDSIILDQIGVLEESTCYRINLYYYEWGTGRRFKLANIIFSTPAMPKVEVQTGDCIKAGENGFTACGKVDSTGLNETVYLQIETSENKEALEENNYNEITIFQYPGIVPTGEYLVDAYDLKPGSVYYYRIIAQNGSGRSQGKIRQVKLPINDD